MATEHVFTKGAIYTDNDFAVRVLSRNGDFVKFMNLGNDQTFRRKISVTYVRGESYEVVDIRKNWDKGFPIAFHVTARGILPEFSEQVISRAKEWYKMLYADDDSQPEAATAEITPVSTDELYPESVADKNVLSFFNSILASNIDTEKYVRVFASMCLYEKITSTSEPHKFSNLPEAEIRMMLGFEARYNCLGSERGMYGLFTNDLNTVNVEDTAKAAKYFVELVHSVFQSDFERATGQTGAEGTKEEEAMTVAETIKTAGTVDAIAETLMKCGKVNDMAIAFRTVTGRDFTGRIVGVNKDNLSYDMAREIKMQFERESFAALTVSEKINFLCERDAYDTGRFLRVCRVEELREIARSIGADTAGVRTDYEMAEKLDYMSAISEKLLFRIGYAQHQPPEEKGTTQVAEIIPATDNDNATASQPADIAQPEALYMDDSYSDAPGDNSCPDMDIPEMHTPDTIHADNHGFTIVHSELITPPDYTVYPDTITDECPYVTVYACDKPEITPHRNPITEAKFKWANQFLLAVFFLCKFIIPVLCAKKSDTHKKFQIGEKYNSICYSGQPCIGKIVGFHEDHYDGEWHKAIMIEYVKNGKYKYDVAPVVTDKGVEIATWCGYPRCEFHADMLIHEATTSNHDMRTPEMRFVVGQDYRLMSYKEEKFTATITARTKNTVSFTCEELFPKGLADIRFFTAPIYIDTGMIQSEYFRVPLFGVCDSANDIPKCSRNNEWCADISDSVQEVHAEINEITPEAKAQPKIRKHNPAPASDIEHKLIDTKDLHFAERRKALDHNAAVISSCMFPEAVISLLSSISLQAILQLGFHMRLFIAKPKGKKNVIAELFAKRLIEYRELRANVRSKPANINAKNSASVPDGVKFFVGARRQICFKFED